ncbi:MAG: sensor histidine kinase [Candidatus Binatia bacterium]
MNETVNILLVDDDMRNLDALEAILQSPDYRLFRARSANEALLTLLSEEFTVIILDIRMPDVNGLELAQLIKQRKKSQHIPIIFLTAYYQEDRDVLEGYGAGAVDYLSKPVNPLILRSKVEVFVDLFRKTGRLAAMNRAMESEIEQRLAELEASLREKEILLKEIHHRVKNNLQIISSLLSLQAQKISEPHVQSLFRQARDRVRSMALVHENLYQSPDLGRAELAEYARALMQSLFEAYGEAAANIRLRLELEPVHLPVDVAIPCGLILNELATNALKHAFHGRPKGEITVVLEAGRDGMIRLKVQDNGNGLPPGLDWRSGGSLGLRLVNMLTEQLNGTLEVRNNHGTIFQLTLPTPEAVQSGVPTENK